MKLYRIENPNSLSGLWYRTDDQRLSGVAHLLNLSGKDLPMEFNLALAAERWKSAAESLEQLKFWFSHEDLTKLEPLGYKLFEIETDIRCWHVTDLYRHPVYQDNSIISKTILDIDLLKEII